MYRLVEALYDQVKGVWEERFEQRYGFWRAFVDDVVNAYLDCGRFESGFARVRCSDCGDEFLVAPSRNQDVFSMVNDLATALEQGSSDAASQASLTTNINAGLMNMDQAIGNILDTRIQVGSRLAAIDNQVDSNGSFVLAYRDTLADIEDLDYAEALSRLSLEVTTLEAAQQSFIRTQSLSLFNYL